MTKLALNSRSSMFLDVKWPKSIGKPTNLADIDNWWINLDETIAMRLEVKACWTVDVVQHVEGEIMKEFAIGVLRDLPHTYSCTCFYLKGKQRWKQKGLYWFWTPGSLNFIQKKVRNAWSTRLYLYFIFIFFIIFFFCKDNPGYLPAVLGLWSQARQWGFILQLLMLMRFPTSPPFMDLSLFKLQG